MESQNKHLATLHSNSPMSGAGGSVRLAYSDRMTMPEAIEAVGRMIAAYPNGGGNAGKSYIGTIAALLTQYPKSVAVQCANPLSGVARETRFLPTVADVVAWCEPEAGRMCERVDREDRVRRQFELRAESDRQPRKPNPLPPGCRANVFIPRESHDYPKLVELAKTADCHDYHAVDTGIWVLLTWITARALPPTWKRYSDDQLRAIYPAQMGA